MQKENRKPINTYKYISAFIITSILFITIFYINSNLDQKRLENVKTIQDQISLDILSSETQFDLLKDTSCRNVNGSILSQEINSLASKLSYLESNSSGKPSSEILYLKKYYSLLQIKDSILTTQLSNKCGSRPISLFYFYGKKDDCPDCEKMSYILTYLRENYPQIRIYSFDANLDLSAIQTLKSMYDISANKLPAFVYKDETYVGFKSIDEMKTVIPEIKKLDTAKAAAEKASAKASSSKSN